MRPWPCRFRGEFDEAAPRPRQRPFVSRAIRNRGEVVRGWRKVSFRAAHCCAAASEGRNWVGACGAGPITVATRYMRHVALIPRSGRRASQASTMQIVSPSSSRDDRSLRGPSLPPLRGVRSGRHPVRVLAVEGSPLPNNLKARRFVDSHWAVSWKRTEESAGRSRTLLQIPLPLRGIGMTPRRRYLFLTRRQHTNACGYPERSRCRGRERDELNPLSSNPQPARTTTTCTRRGSPRW